MYWFIKEFENEEHENLDNNDIDEDDIDQANYEGDNLDPPAPNNEPGKGSLWNIPT